MQIDTLKTIGCHSHTMMYFAPQIAFNASNLVKECPRNTLFQVHNLERDLLGATVVAEVNDRMRNQLLRLTPKTKDTSAGRIEDPINLDNTAFPAQVAEWI